MSTDYIYENNRAKTKKKKDKNYTSWYRNGGENAYPHPFEYSVSFACKVFAPGLECHFWPPRNILTEAFLKIARLNTGTKYQPLLWQEGLRQP